jgi:general L-amino acid transport system permease protein
MTAVLADPDAHYVSQGLIPPSAPPRRNVGVGAWLRRNLFSSVGDGVLTVIAALLLLWLIPPVIRFLLPHFDLGIHLPMYDLLPDWLRGLINHFNLSGNAVPFGAPVESCRVEGVGACWGYVWDRFDFFIYGFYPQDQYWRVNIIFALGALLIFPMLTPRFPFKRLNIFLFLVGLPIATLILIPGGQFGLTFIPTEKWGGLMVTLIISVVGITWSLPLGIVLALGRQSRLPVIKTVCILFIELWRAVPLITVLFMASVMLPLFMPEGTTVDKLLRALVGVTLFEGAYLAETVRGGLQALPRGQYEAADSLGLNYWKKTTFIILPQALKHVIPGIVGIFDLLLAVQNSSNNPDWKSPTTPETGYIAAGVIFWIFCFSMSRYARYMELRLNTGHRR